MFETITLTFIASISTFVPIWSRIKKNGGSKLVDGNSPNFEPESLNNFVISPDSHNPNFKLSHAVELPEEAKQFFEEFLSLLNKGQETLLQNLSPMPYCVAEKLNFFLEEQNINLASLSVDKQANAALQYFMNMHLTQARTNGKSSVLIHGEISKTSQLGTNATSADVSSGSDGGDVSFLIWLISSLLFSVYALFRIHELKKINSENSLHKN
jgi:hypothetical protein